VAPGIVGGVFDDSKYQFVNFDVHAVIADLDEFLRRLKIINQSVKVIFTVSPVPLIATFETRHVLLSTTYSKSVLRIAADESCKRFDWVDYFPSYEIITGNFNNSVYYDSDYRNVNEIGVDHVMRCFLHHYVNGEFDANNKTEFMCATGGVDVICDEEAINQIQI